MQKMREIIKQSSTSILILFSFLFLFTGCDNVLFQKSIREQLEQELSVTYNFYEYDDFNSPLREKKFLTGKLIYSSSFPTFTHTDTIIAGWKYLGDKDNTAPVLPSNFYLNEKDYITAINVGTKSENLYAVWKTKCTVTFVTNSDFTIPQIEMAQGDYLELPVVDSRRGKFRFDGWFLDSEFNEYFDPGQPIMTDLTLYAKWTQINKITFHKNDGTNETSVIEWDVDSWITVPDEMFGLRKGYGFLCWSTDSKGTINSSIFYGGDSFIIQEDIDLYAVWSKDVVTIKYIDPEGKYPARFAQYGRGAHVTVGRALSDNGYYYQYLFDVWTKEGKELHGFDESSNKADSDGLRFDPWGWYNDGNGYGSNFITIDSDMTLYVYWSDIIFTVQFMYKDQFGQYISYLNEQQVKWNERLTRPEDPFVPSYEFEDWYLAKWNPEDGCYYTDTLFDFNTKFTDSNFENKNNYGSRYIVIIGKFIELDGFKIIYHNIENAVPVGDAELVYNYEENNDEIILPEMKKPGYIFEGWYSDSLFTPESKITSIPANSEGNKEVWAKFTIVYYNITYDLNGGEIYLTNPSSYCVEDYCILEEPYRTGYSFEGWYLEDTEIKIKNLYGSTGDLKLVARWEIIHYLITYVLNGGTNSPLNPETYTFEESIIFEPAEKDGYVFEGWYTDPDFGVDYKITGIPAGNIGEQTLYAKFIDNTGSLTAIITFAENPESDINVDGPVQNGNLFTFTAESGYTSYQWYLNGVLQTGAAYSGNSITLDVSDWASGYHDISLIVFDGTEYWSWSGQLHKE